MDFKIPIKQIIVNSDDQARLLEDDGSVYADGDCTPSAGGFIVEGFSSLILGSELEVMDGSTTRIISEAAAVAVAEISSFDLSSLTSGGSAGDVFRLVYESLDHEEVEHQNFPLEKRYQLSADTADAAATVVDLVNVINADAEAPVVAYAGFNNVTPAQDDSGKILLIAKDTGINFYLYSEKLSISSAEKDAVGTTVYHTAEGTNNDTILASRGLGNYDSLKTKHWPDAFDNPNYSLDRGIEYFPQKGATYTSYRFRAAHANQISSGGNPQPGEVTSNVLTDYYMFVQTGTTLETQMDLLVGDVNV